MHKNMLVRSFSGVRKNNFEKQYLNLVSNIIKHGDKHYKRNSNVYSLFGEKMSFCLKHQKIPLLTTKKVAWRTCLKELLWFINGNTDNTILQKQQVGIWNGNASREFLDSRDLYHLKENDLGPVYGHQWRHFNAPYTDCNDDYTNKGVDQLQMVVDQLKDPEERYSRRIIMSAWNPQQLSEMALPPCHVMSQFCVNSKDELTCLLYQRSGDVGLGIPFNIASYSFLTHLLAHHCDLQPKRFIHFIGDAHIYENHVEMLKTQLTRKPFLFPKLSIRNKYDFIDDYTLKDFKIKNYKYNDTLKMNMIA
jgi:thymidylate synthase